MSLIAILTRRLLCESHHIVGAYLRPLRLQHHCGKSAAVSMKICDRSALLSSLSWRIKSLASCWRLWFGFFAFIPVQLRVAKERGILTLASSGVVAAG